MGKSYRDFVDGFDERQARRRALPSWFAFAHLAIFTCSLLVSVLAYIYGITTIYSWLHPGRTLLQAPEFDQRLMLVPAFFGIFGPTFALANFLEWAIKPMRDTWNRHFEGVPGASLTDAVKTTYWLLGASAVCVAISFVGALSPWGPK